MFIFARFFILENFMSRSIKLNPYRSRNKGKKDDKCIVMYKLQSNRKWKKNKRIWKISKEKKELKEEIIYV